MSDISLPNMNKSSSHKSISNDNELKTNEMDIKEEIKEDQLFNEWKSICTLFCDIYNGECDEDDALNIVKEALNTNPNMVNEKHDWHDDEEFRVFDPVNDKTHVGTMKDITLIHLACWTGCFKIIKYIYNNINNADFESLDHWNRTPLMYAIKSSEQLVMYLLRVIGVDADKKDIFNFNAFDLCTSDTEGNRKLESAIYLYARHSTFYDVTPEAFVVRVRKDVREFDEMEFNSAMEGVKDSRFPIISSLKVARIFDKMSDLAASRRSQFLEFKAIAENTARELFISIKDEDEAAAVLQLPNGILETIVAGDMLYFAKCGRLQQFVADRWWGELNYENLNYDVWQLAMGNIKMWFRLFRSPVCKFYMDGLSAIIFVILFSILTTQGINVNDGIHFTEACMWLFGIGMIFNESDEIFSSGWYAYWNESWNSIDWTLILILIGHFYVRIVDSDSHTLQVIHTTVTAIGVILVWIRAMFLAEISEDIGQLLIAVKKMIKDVLTFAYLQLILLAGFSFSFWLIIDGDAKALKTTNFTTLRETFLVLFQTAIAGDPLYEFDNLEFFREVLLQILSSLYLVLASVVLVNLLIATMGTTYSDVKDEAEGKFLLLKVATFVKYDQSLNLLPPPLNIIPLLALGISPIFFCCFKSLRKSHCAYCHTSFNGDKSLMQCKEERCKRFRRNVKGVPLFLEKVSISILLIVVFPFAFVLVIIYTLSNAAASLICPRQLHKVQDYVISGQRINHGRRRKVRTDRRINWLKFISEIDDQQIDKALEWSKKMTSR